MASRFSKMAETTLLALFASTTAILPPVFAEKYIYLSLKFGLWMVRDDPDVVEFNIGIKIINLVS